MGMGSFRPHPGRFTLGKETNYTWYRRLRGPQGRSRRVRNISRLQRFDPRTVQPVASRYTDYAIPTHERLSTSTNINTFINTSQHDPPRTRTRTARPPPHKVSIEQQRPLKITIVGSRKLAKILMFLGAFADVRKAIINFVMSVCAHRTRFLPDGFS